MSVEKRAFIEVESATRYHLPVYTIVEGKGIEKTEEVQEISFVRGSKMVDEVHIERRDGIIHESLISAIIQDLTVKGAILPSRENSTAITKLQEALFWIEERARQRQMAGVIGTYKPIEQTK